MPFRRGDQHIPCVGKWNTHQHDSLIIDSNQCSNGTLVDVLRPLDLLLPLLVQQHCKPVFVVKSSSTRMYVALFRLPDLSFRRSPCVT